jgi:hypothetical protein
LPGFHPTPIEFTAATSLHGFQLSQGDIELHVLVSVRIWLALRVNNKNGGAFGDSIDDALMTVALNINADF